MHFMRLGRNDALRTVRRAQLLKNIEADIGDLGAGGGQPVDGGVKGGGHLRVEFVEQIAARQGKAQPGQRKTGLGAAFTAGHQIIQNGAAFGACCHRAGGIERGGQRIDAGGRHPACRRLHPDNAAQRRRRAGRPAGIGADGRRRHVVGD